MKTSTNKNLSLEGLRGVACVAVFSCHFLYVIFPYLARGRTVDQSPFIPKWTWETWFSNPPFTLFYNGDFAVSVFFVLSGYVLLRKFYRNGDINNLLSGIIKRYPRLILPSAASIAFVFLLMHAGLMHAQDVPDWSIAGWIKSEYTFTPSIKAALNAAFIGVPFKGDEATLAWNNPLWTIRIEFLASVTLFASYVLFGRRKIIAVFAFVAFAFWVGMPLYYLPFIAGATLNGKTTEWLKRHSRLSFAMFCVGMALGLFDYTQKFHWMSVISPAPDSRTFWFDIGAVFTVAGVIGSTRLVKFFGSKVAVYFGRVSFALYLLHVPLLFSFGIWSIEKFMAFGAPYLYAAWLAYAATFVLAIISSEVFYRTVDSLSTKFADKLAEIIICPPSTPEHFEAAGDSPRKVEQSPRQSLALPVSRDAWQD